MSEYRTLPVRHHFTEADLDAFADRAAHAVREVADLEDEKRETAKEFKTRIDGLDLHFIQVQSPHEDAQPLVLVHGWPGSVYEFYKIIPMLTEPEKYGGRVENAFHVVCPSLPGFGFSELPKERGWNSQRMAEVIAKLMARLGYGKYGAQGGDWGSGIVRWLAENDGSHCVGSHSNFPLSGAPRVDPMRDVTAEESKRFERRSKGFKRRSPR